MVKNVVKKLSPVHPFFLRYTGLIFLFADPQIIGSNKQRKSKI